MNAFPLQRRRDVAVLDSTMSYVEAGEGEPLVVFLHGNPTSSYVWRDIIRCVAEDARCIAPDLIGFGQSGKPDIGYRFVDQVRYLDAFLTTIGAGRMAIVAQDWGSALAFHRAARFPETIVGLAFMEFIRPVSSWEEFHQRPEARALFRAFRTPGEGERLILEENAFIEGVLPHTVLRKLSPGEMDVYRAPFPTPQTRKPMLALPRDLPIAGEPEDVVRIAAADQAALRRSTYPKLLFYGEPGAVVSPAAAEAFAGELLNCEPVFLGPGGHNLQEDHGEAIGRRLQRWLTDIGAVAVRAA